MINCIIVDDDLVALNLIKHLDSLTAYTETTEGFLGVADTRIGPLPPLDTLILWAQQHSPLVKQQQAQQQLVNDEQQKMNQRLLMEIEKLKGK